MATGRGNFFRPVTPGRSLLATDAIHFQNGSAPMERLVEHHRRFQYRANRHGIEQGSNSV